MVWSVLWGASLWNYLVIDRLKFLCRNHLLLMPNLNDTLVFERHFLLILTSIIVMTSFICIWADLSYSTLILGSILLSIIWTLEVLFLWYLILIVLNVPGLVIYGIFCHQGVICDETLVPLVQLLYPLSFLLLLFLLDLKHSRQIKKLPFTAPWSFDLLNLMWFFQLSHEVFLLVLSWTQEIPTVHIVGVAHSTHQTSSLLGHITFISWKRPLKKSLDSLVVVLSHVIPVERRYDAVIS